MSDRIDVRHADCREAIKAIPDASIDACVTDPPYALVSIQKRFGKSGSAPAQEGSDGLYRRASAGFMGQQWDTGETAFDPDFWREVYRVLKPGAHLLAFSGTRTYHRMACAIEDAGFEIRDMTAWLYGSGFPKSHDVSKAIDKLSGHWRGRAGAVKATTVGQVAKGTEYERSTKGDPITAAAAAAWDGWGTALKPALEPICLARKPLNGTVAGNVLTYGTGALNIDECRIEAEKETGWGGAAAGGNTWNESNSVLSKDGESRPVQGRWPANVVHDGSDEVLAAFPETNSGALTAAQQVNGGFAGTVNCYGKAASGGTNEYSANAGSAARFFYSAKADANDRMGSKHPTVKPVDLMRWLIRLVTPPDGLVLDPFAGTGSTGIAAIAEGVRAVLIEREAAYVADIHARINHVRGLGPLSDQLKQRNKLPSATPLPLFGEVA